MRYKLTIVLILLNVALLGTIVYLDKGTAEEDPLGRRVFRPGVVERATAITLLGPDDVTRWELRKEEDVWSLQEPVLWPANVHALERILTQMEMLEWKTRFTISELAGAGQSLDDYGLGSPAGAIVVETATGTTRLEIGASTEIGNHLYLRTPDRGHIAVVGWEFIDSLGLPVADLRESRIFSIPSFEVRSLRLAITEPGNLTVRLARQGSNWSFELPFEDQANSEAVEAALAGLAGLEVLGFAESEEAATGAAAMRITLEGNRRRETLLLEQRVADTDGVARYRARMEGRATAFEVDAALLDSLRTAQESLREKRFFRFPVEQVTGVRIRQGDQETVLRRLETGPWRVLPESEDGNGGISAWPAEEPVVRSLLELLANLRADEFISDVPSADDVVRYGFDEPQREVTVELPSGARTLVLGEIATSDRGLLIYATREVADFVYKVRPQVLYATRLDALHYKDRLVESAPVGSPLEEIALMRRSGEEESLIWRFTPGEEPVPEAARRFFSDPASADALISLASYLRELRARDYVLPAFTDPLKLDEDSSLPWTYRMTWKRGSNETGGDGAVPPGREILLSERIGGTTQFAGSAEHDLVFTLPRSVIDLMTVLTAARAEEASIPAIEPAPEAIVVP